MFITHRFNFALFNIQENQVKIKIISAGLLDISTKANIFRMCLWPVCQENILSFLKIYFDCSLTQPDSCASQVTLF